MMNDEQTQQTNEERPQESRAVDDRKRAKEDEHNLQKQGSHGNFDHDYTKTNLSSAALTEDAVLSTPPIKTIKPIRTYQKRIKPVSESTVRAESNIDKQFVY